jgi:hypothetical protein
MAGFAALFLAWSLTASAAPTACYKAYKPAYEADWGAGEEAWRAACRREGEARIVLRRIQKDSVRKCASKFKSAADKQHISLSSLNSMCAQGAYGREQLRARIGVPDTAKKSVNIEIRPVGAAGMGPIGRAIDLAKTVWRQDACFAGLNYRWWKDEMIPKDEYNRKGGRKLKGVPVGLESFEYYFISPSEDIEMYYVRIHDHMNDIFKTEVIRSDGPEHTTKGRKSEFSNCLQDVQIDTEEAATIANKGGLVMGEELPVSMQLRRYSRDYFQDPLCKVVQNENKSRLCSQAWDRNETRTLERRDLWSVAVDGDTAFVDATTRGFIYLGYGRLSTDAYGKFIRNDPRKK